MRPSKRNNNELRNIQVTHNFTKYAEGSVLIELGNTKIICTASVLSGVPKFKNDSNEGWLTVEYGMLPRSTHVRMDRESTRGKQSGRTQEIQRLIGRSLRASIDLKILGKNTIKIDCDVIQADGGTRTTSITGASLAMIDAIKYMKKNNMLSNKYDNKSIVPVAAVSVGIYNNEVILDLDYDEDSKADTDMNIVMNSNGGIIEIQGTAEGKEFSEQEFIKMFSVARKGIKEIFNSIF